jgi:hypothetical protein
MEFLYYNGGCLQFPAVSASTMFTIATWTTDLASVLAPQIQSALSQVAFPERYGEDGPLPHKNKAAALPFRAVIYRTLTLASCSTYMTPLTTSRRFTVPRAVPMA